MPRTTAQHETATQSWPELLFSPAIDAPGRGWRISGFGLLIVAVVVIVALLNAPAVFSGGVVAAAGLSKTVKLVQKKFSPQSPKAQSG